jgi:hypothetical protein|tara:strand:+ start:12409 stop:12636 length:228 start_codon:yes stop_codon:yes gene_type:complete
MEVILTITAVLLGGIVSLWILVKCWAVILVIITLALWAGLIWVGLIGGGPLGAVVGGVLGFPIFGLILVAVAAVD